MQNIYTILITLCMLTISGTVVAGMITDVLKKINKKNVRQEEELMFVLNTTIDREFKYVQYLEYELKGIILIKDFESELTKLVERTMNAFSTDFLEELQYYYTLNYITKHVTKSHQILLTKFIKENKIDNTINKRKK